MRLGILPASWRFNRPVWVHAVSVGEMAAMRPLLAKLRRDYPGQQLLLTTVTPTGNKIARSLAADGDIVAYLPLDLSFIVRSVVKRIDPRMVIIAETEFWPNLLNAFARRNIPVVVVNGRISDRSMPKYRLVRRQLGPLLNSVKVFCMQTENDAARLISLGVNRQRVYTCGNLKFDLDWPQPDPAQRQKQRGGIGLGPDDRLWVAASTHAGEEDSVLRVYQRLAGQFPGLRLLIVPRHPERGKEVAALVSRCGYQPYMFSAPGAGRVFADASCVGVLDVVGKLMQYYALADIVFVGGSLVPVGGHNILEPAYFGLPVIFGKYMQNFRAIEKLFLQEHAAVRVADEEALASRLQSWLSDPPKAHGIGSRARTLVLKHQGAAEKCMRLIGQVLSNREEQHA